MDVNAATAPVRACILFLYRSIVLIGGCCLLAGNLQAQNRLVHGMVVNQSSKEKIAFASISWKHSKKGALTDSTGAFLLSANTHPDTLIISHVGFVTHFIPVNPGDTAMLLVALEHKQSDRVVVLSHYNRGLFWWKKVVLQKDENNPYKFNSYSYQLYKKLEVDLNNVNREKFANGRLLKPFDFVLNNIDTTGGHSRLPVFMTETLSRNFATSDPAKKREDIQAIQTSGVKNDVILQLIDKINQKINIYDNGITLFGKEFISPLSDNGDAYYNYRAADTLYIDGRRFLHLFFTPKRQGEYTFSGDCWLYSATWAVQKITLTISPTANINYVNQLVISQEFAQQHDGSWMFAKDKWVADFYLFKKDKESITVHQTAVYNDVHVNENSIATMLEHNTETDMIQEDDSAHLRTVAFWQSNRPEPLSRNEQQVYSMIDTLTGLPVFKKYTNKLEFIVDGRKKMGPIEIGPWYKWVSGNQIEKRRVRFDVGTTAQFSKALYLHSYIAYGFGDQKMKGGVDASYRFPGNNGYVVQASYIHDLDNGVLRITDDNVSMDNVFSQMIRRPGIRQKFIGVDEIKVGVSKDWSNNLSARLFISRTGYETFTPLPPKKLLSINDNDIDNTELGLTLRYAPGEKKITTHRKSIRLRGKAPVFEAHYVMGMRGLLGGQYQYYKASISLKQHVHITGWGKIDYNVYGGKIWSNKALPFMLLELHPGNETYYYSKQAFNLMNRFEYFSDKYAGFSVEHDFEKKLINLLPFLRKVNVRQFWNVKAVIGDLSPASKKLNCRDYGSYRLTSLQGKPYVELGTGLDNIFRYFRTDLVWRLNAANIAAVPPTRQQPIHHFGIFGSFHIQF